MIKTNMNEKTILLKDIKPNAWNPNEMTKEEFAEFVKEVQHLGKIPKKIILRQKEDFYEIVDGEHSYKALKELEIEALQEDWYEIVEVDDIEAKRQTYKRNLGGKNNPVKLGLMFAQALEESGISNRKLAEQWEVSEGMIRNHLLYAEIAKLRSDYANLAKLTNDQVRTYLKIAEYAKPIADYWLACGGLKDALLVLDESNVTFDKAGYNVMATFQKLSEHIMKQGFDKVLPLKNNRNIPFDFSQKAKEQYIATFKNGFSRASHLQNLLEQMKKYFVWDKKVTQEYMLEYLAIYYNPPRFINDYWIQTIISTSIRKVDSLYEFMLTPDELRECMKFEYGKEGLPFIMEKIKEVIKKKHNIPTYELKATSEPLENKLDRLKVTSDAPDFIKSSTFIHLRLKSVFLDMQFANEEAKKEAWEIFVKNYQEKDFKKINLANTKIVQEKINSLVNHVKQRDQKQKAIASLVNKSEQELAELFVEKLRPLTKDDKNFENDLVPRMVKNFKKEYLFLFVWLASKYYDEISLKEFLASLKKAFSKETGGKNN